MVHARVQIAKYTDGKCTKGVGDLRSLGKTAVAEEVYHVAGERNQYHHGGLLPFRFVDNREAEGEDGDEDEPVIWCPRYKSKLLVFAINRTSLSRIKMHI
jgi:hypothetical protein